MRRAIVLQARCSEGWYGSQADENMKYDQMEKWKEIDGEMDRHIYID